jgi:hypothetical protein
MLQAGIGDSSPELRKLRARLGKPRNYTGRQSSDFDFFWKIRRSVVYK